MRILKTLRTRGLALFVALVMCLGMLPTAAFANTYDQITVKYVVNGVTLRTETLSSGRYIQIANRVPYVSDLIAGTAYADYDYGTVTNIVCNPLQYFPGSAHTLREGQSIEHSGNYKNHTITYTTSKWEKHTGTTNPGTTTPPETSGGGSYFLQAVYVNNAKTKYTFGPRIASSSTARIWYYDNRPAAPKGYTLAGWQTSHYHGTNGFLTKSWWQIFGGSEGTRLYVMSGNQAGVVLNSGEGVYLIYQGETPASYSYTLNYDYNGGTLNGNSSDQVKAEDKSDSTWTFTAKTAQPTRRGYTFAGWTYTGDGSYSSGQVKMTGTDGSTVSGTLTAQWRVDPNAKATLTYDANGGTNPPAAQQVTLGSEAIVADKGDMTRSGGYVFLGWSTDQRATEADIYPEDGLLMNDDLTLYAVWKKVELATVTVNKTLVNATKADLPDDYAIKVYADNALMGTLTKGNLSADRSTDSKLMWYQVVSVPKGSTVKLQEVNYNTKDGRTPTLSGNYSDDATKSATRKLSANLTGANFNLINTYTPTAPKASYTVEWKDTLGNTLKASETRTGGTVGQTATVNSDDKSINGYDYVKTGSVESAEVKADGSTKLTLYFQPKKPDHSFLYNLAEVGIKLQCQDLPAHKDERHLTQNAEGSDWWCTSWDNTVCEVNGKYQWNMTIDAEKYMTTLYPTHVLTADQAEKVTLTFTWNTDAAKWELPEGALPVVVKMQGHKTTYI